MKKLFVVLLALLLIGPFSVFAETISLSSGDNLQSALNNASPGDTIILEAGATFVGPIRLPRKNGDSYITIRSSRTSDLPSGRVSPAHASLMAKIVTPGSGVFDASSIILPFTTCDSCAIVIVLKLINNINTE